MTSRNLKSAIWLTLAAGALAFAAGAPAYGKGPPPGKGNKPPTEVGNNLSVPAIMAGGAGDFETLVCGDDAFSVLVPPDTGPMAYAADCATGKDGVEKCVDAGYYFVQRDAAWQAPCMVTASATALGAWGDNLGGDAILKVGSPIRVELVLWDYAVAAGQSGYHVIKLEPNELDRLSDYGHWAEGEEGGRAPIEYEVGETYADVPGVVHDFVGTFGAIVHDPGATLTIQQLDDDGNPVGDPVYAGPAGGEINATGKIVYGHNLRVEAAGTYRLTYFLPNVALSDCEEDAAFCEGNTASLDIVVTAGGGGGKKSQELLTVTERTRAQEQEQLQVQDQVRSQ